jgi:hypothetical protein
VPEAAEPPAQSPSTAALHPEGQQPSPVTHVMIGVWTHAASQVCALPVTWSAVHAFPSSHVTGHDADGSHCGPHGPAPPEADSLPPEDSSPEQDARSTVVPRIGAIKNRYFNFVFLAEMRSRGGQTASFD